MIENFHFFVLLLKRVLELPKGENHETQSHF